MQSFIKKYEQEHRHRITLEKELKEVRLTLMRGPLQPPSQTNISFGDAGKFATNTKEPSSDRERELSEIREMIAKTYKVVNEGGAAERDLSKNPSKRVLF